MMKLIILAAGSGSRLRPLTTNIPKVLLPLSNGCSLLEKQIIAAINSNNFEEIVIITGYYASKIDLVIKKYMQKIKINTIYNPMYNQTSPIISLWTSLYKLEDDDFMLINGDTIYDEELYQTFNKDESIQLYVSRDLACKEDDVKVTLDATNSIKNVSKKLPEDMVDAISAGMLLVKGRDYRELFICKILDFVKNESYVKNGIWHDIIDALVKENVTVQAVLIDKSCWHEIDTINDYNELRKTFSFGKVK